LLRRQHCNWRAILESLDREAPGKTKAKLSSVDPVNPVILSKKEFAMLNQELTEKVIGCAFRVYNTMGFGYEESVYERCLLIELREAGLAAENQIPIEVFYKGTPVGHFRADIVVEGVLILELKSIRALAPAHEAQLVNYLVATGTDLGLLLNFAATKVEVKRKTRLLAETG